MLATSSGASLQLYGILVNVKRGSILILKTGSYLGKTGTKKSLAGLGDQAEETFFTALPSHGTSDK